MTRPRLRISPEPADSPVARALVDAVQDEYRARYGGPDETPVESSEFNPPAGVFAVVWLDGDPVGSGALRRRDASTVEIKRMYVAPRARRQGVARRLLAWLEAAARSAGYERVVLETGDQQPEALELYRRAGYSPIEPYGHYKCHPDAHSLGRWLHDSPASLADADAVASGGRDA